jgi:hypothetical protein
MPSMRFVSAVRAAAAGGLAVLLAGPGCLTRRPPPAPPPEPVPPEIAAAVSPYKRFDHRPYEFIWSERDEEEEPLVDFEALMGWTVEVEGGGAAEFTRTDDHQLWDLYIGQLVFSNATPATRFRLVPPAPIPIRDRFDTVTFWVHSAITGAPAPAAAAAAVQIEIGPRDGSPLSLPLATVDWRGWWMVQRRLDAEQRAGLSFPCTLNAIEIQPGAAREGRFLFDSLCVFTERLPPMALEPRPESNLSLFPGQSAGLHVGPGRLPFPTREETILPTNLTTRFRGGVLADPDGTYRLFYTGDDGELIYHLDPSSPFGPIRVFWNGVAAGTLLKDAGVDGLGKPGPGTLLVLRPEGDAIRAEFSSGLQCDFRIHQKSLVIDAVLRGGAATGMALGHIAHAQNPRVVRIPLLSGDPDHSPAVGLIEAPGDGANTPLFVTALIDWYRSNASALWFRSEVARGNLMLTGGARYQPATDGQRADLMERIMVTVSPRLEEVLPSIPNPAGFHAAEAWSLAWVEPESPIDYATELARSARLRRYGLASVIQCSGRDVWQDEDESFSLRTRAAPHRGGDAELKRYVTEQRARGWRLGLYANYRDLSPLSARWSAQDVQRLPDRNWRIGSPANYVLAAPRSVEWQKQLAPRLRRLFGVDASYLDMHSGQPPWFSTDFDARIPGAGTFAQTLYAYGELMRHESDVYGGPVVGPGEYLWIYAGLMDAFRGSASDPALRAGQPYLPIYELMMIRPLACGYGMGSLDEFFSGVPGWSSRADRSLDEYLAAQIAYGRAGRVVELRWGLRRVCRSYYMMQQLQTRYGGRAARRVAYWDGEHFWPVSEALVNGAWQRSQLYTSYPGDLEVWVNGSVNASWTVKRGRDTWTLPPYGWVAAGPDFLDVSAELDGRRVDYVDSPAYIYYDGGDAWTPFRGVACAGSLVITRATVEGAATWRVLDITGAGRFGFRPPGAGPALRARAIDGDGVELDPPALHSDAELDWVTGAAGALHYELEYAP